MDNKRHYTTLTKLFACAALVGLMAIGRANAQTHVVVHGSVFGGGNEATVSGNTEVLMQQNATVKTDVYGGGAFASTGTENGNNTTIVTIEGGTVGDADYGTDGKGNVFGGALGDATHSPDVNGAITVNIGTSTQSSNNVVVKGNIFGCNNAAGTPKDSVRVHIYHTAHTPDNGVGSYTDMEDFTDFVKNDAAAHAPESFALQSVYGGGNKADYTPASGKGARVHIHNCDNTVKMVYGGGRAAAVGTNSVNANTSITVDGGRLDTLFAGGDGHTKDGSGNYLAADINGNVSAWVRCGYYSAVFGASNTSGTITGTKSVTIDYSGPCANNSDDEFIASLFGGGNMADIEGNVELTIACGAGEFDEVYGGSNMASIDNGDVTLNLYGGKYHSVFGGSKGVVGGAAANIGGKVTLNLYGGTMVNAFGGSNQNGNITGAITVNVLDKETANCVLRIDSLYGAGNVTAYKPTDTTIISPVVNLMHINNSGAGVTGDVFGGGLGLTATVTANPQVNIGYDATTQSSLKPAGYSEPAGFPIAKVGNNVYGGGDAAKVVGNTAVNIGTTGEGGTVNGSVFGAGKGTSDYIDVARVTGTSTVTFTKGWVKGSVYGGGELSSVGTYTFSGTDSIPTGTAPTAGGATSVTVNGTAVVGPNDMTMPTIDGMVFGAGKGIVTDTTVSGNKVNALAYSGASTVIIGGTAFVKGSVYGGSQNGHVLGNTHVTIQDNCQIGAGYDYSTGHSLPMYATLAWTVSSGMDTSGTFKECHHWPYDAAHNGVGYDPNALSTQKYANGSDAYALPTGQDGRTFYGNVFGGGSGYLPYCDASGVSQWVKTAGRVRGNTVVDITGGHILTSVYGGNEMTDVTGSTTINMTAGTVGVPRKVSDMKAHPVTCYVFGAGKGDPRTFFNTFTDVASTTVNITGTARIYGSTFGGGEDGHVDGNAVTNIGDVKINGASTATDGSGVIIGTTGTSDVDGNVFGGGRGYSALARTIGLIQGNVQVNISDGKIYGSVFGGGRTAAVGAYQVAANDANYGKLQDGADHGNITVTISGGEIGRIDGSGNIIASKYTIGDVFGGGKGLADPTNGKYYGLVKNTTVDINGTAKVYGSVYGGGEISSVGNKDETADTPNSDGRDEFGYKTGLAKVTISGTAQIGTLANSMGEHGKGYVYGSGKGQAGTGYSMLAFVKNTKVTIGTSGSSATTPTVYGSVFGGGEDGHVRHDTKVYIYSGTIGSALTSEEIVFDPVTGASTSTVWRGNVYAGGRGVDLDAGGHYSVTAGSVFGNAYLYMTGGHVYHNIYGSGAMASVGSITGGPGTYTGEVMNTTNNYAEGTFESNTGVVTIDISGGTVGDDSQENHKGRNNGRVFGAGRGLAVTIESNAHAMEYVYSTNVTIRGNAQVLGAVFGGGENGHVKTDAVVNIQGNCVIGSPLLFNECQVSSAGARGNAFRGNVFGGGRGVDPVDDVDGTSHRSFTAGRVFGNTTVNVSGGLIYRAVYGGGLLATVGDPTKSATKNDNGTPDNTKDDYFEIAGWDQTVPNGIATVNISGGWIGNVSSTDQPLTGSGSTYGEPGRNNGAVFGSGCGFMATDVNSHEYSQMGYVYRSIVNISDSPDASGKHTHIRAAVFGGGENGHVWENAFVNVSGGTIGNATDGSNGGDFAFAGNVFGSGRGMNVTIEGDDDIVSTTAGWVKGNTYVNVSGGTICRDVYGGGNLGSVGVSTDNATGLTTVNITGGNIYGNVYGASRGVASTQSEYHDMAYVKNTNVTVTGTARIHNDTHTDGDNGGSVYGGGNAGHVRKNTSVTIGNATLAINNGVTTSSATAYTGGTVDVDVYGAGRGDVVSATAGIVNHNVLVNINTGATVGGDVYGGAAIANSNVHDQRNPSPDAARTVYADESTCAEPCTTTVNILGGTVTGNVYGGGKGKVFVESEYTGQNNPATGTTYTQAEINDIETYTLANGAAMVWGDVQVNIGNSSTGTATIGGYVFGCNNAAGSPQGNVKVDVYRTAHTTDNGFPTTADTLAAPTDVLDSNDLKLLPITADRFALKGVYGGGNKADYTNSTPGAKTTVTIHYCDENTCQYVYGGGRAADSKETSVIVEGGRIYRLFAGGDGSTTDAGGNPLPANVTGNASVLVKGGIINQIFGGSNTSGTVHGTANVHFETSSSCDFVASDVFGGGNEAPGGSAVVTVPCGTTGLSDVYGGARNADIGTPTDRKNIVLTIEGGDMTRVFGGNMSGGTIYGDVTVNVYGSNPGHVINEVFGGSNEGGNIVGNIVVNIDSNRSDCPLNVNYVYGGGNLVSYVPDSTGGTGSQGGYAEESYDATRISPIVNLKQGSVKMAVFGGGKGHPNLVPVFKPKTQAEWTALGHTDYYTTDQAYADSLAAYNTYLGQLNAAKVKSNPKVVIGTTEAARVEAGRNPTARVGIHGVSNYLKGEGNVYGGGNAAPVEGNTAVDIRGNNTNVFGSVYGGGNAAKVTGNTDVTIGDRVEP